MATVVFTVSVSSDAKTLTAVVTNWDSVTPAYIYIKKPDEDDYETPLTYTPGAAPETIPIYYSGDAFTLSGSADDIIPDGVYEIKISGNDTAPISTDTAVYFFTDLQTKCCLSSKIANITDYDCDDCKKTKQLNQLFMLKLLLEGAEHDATTSCGDWTQAQTKLNYVSEFCGEDGNCYQSGCS